MAKYDALREFLTACSGTDIKLRFTEMEQIIGSRLPTHTTCPTCDARVDFSNPFTGAPVDE